MGWAHVLNQGLAGLVLEFLEGRRADVDRQGFCPGFQVAGAFSLQAEYDFSHAGYLLLSGSIFGLFLRFCGCGWIRGTALRCTET